jgi:cytochrome c2
MFITVVLGGCGPTTQPLATPARAAPEPTLTATLPPLPTATRTPALSPTPEAVIEREEATPTATPNSIDFSEADLAQGIEIYHQNYCGVCHTLTVADTKGTFGPSQDNMGVTAEQRIQDSSYKGSATTAKEYLLESLVNPQAHVVDGYQLTRHKMPSFSHLDDTALQALVQMLLQQKQG